ncbi:HAMP domain-containing sensor histidine kinase [Eubacterium sp. 1001713B170207_170306_E7]|uniref:sensor histidine kinase n=1 Tax=Eubacterium sp. 1001713B170207_170306_E7 TaxID=2787097 RepID=UPI001899A354|nr:HAMP domain-containing sensor histidine kinase [Eubacterium sp. 1001713B170207_170306_E7]
MEAPLIIFCTILGAAALIAVTHILLLKKQLRDIIRQNHFIQNEDTNLPITAAMPDKEVEALIESINTLLETHRQFEIRMTQANRSFKNSITSISHDLRTPLTSASGYIQMLQDFDLPEETQAEYLEIVQQRIQAVRKLLDQLFEFARIEADELILAEEPVNLGNVLRDTLALFYNDFCSQDSEPEIQIPDDPFIVTGDADAFKRIFSNILSNALTHGEGRFAIKAELKSNTVDITFKNSTHSITPDDLPCIFDRFYTTDASRSRKTTGLGLSIAKRLAARMGGSIDASLEDDVFGIHLQFSLK